MFKTSNNFFPIDVHNQKLLAYRYSYQDKLTSFPCAVHNKTQRFQGACSNWFNSIRVHTAYLTPTSPCRGILFFLFIIFFTTLSRSSRSNPCRSWQVSFGYKILEPHVSSINLLETFSSCGNVETGEYDNYAPKSPTNSICTAFTVQSL